MRLVIVGGVAGGMSCAARARRLDESAEIIVLDRGEHVSFANCGLPYYVGGEIAEQDTLLVQTPKTLRAALNLDVRTGHDVIGLDAAEREIVVRTAAGVERIGYDALVLAPGATAARPPVPGLGSPRVRTLRSVEDAVALRTRADAGLTRVVVLGAGFIGVETAEVLARRGVETILVEYADQVLPPLDAEHAWLVSEELRRLGVDVRTSVAAERIVGGSDRDTVIFSDGARVETDLILLATGVRPDTAVFEQAGVECERGAIRIDEHGRTSLPGVWAVGDATVSADPITGARRPVALAGPANRAGRLVADAILRPGSARPLPQPLGTAIVRVGELTAAMTGANRASLLAAHLPFRTLHLHPNQHAGYFPGASQIHLSLHIDPADGRILGAQAVGADGVDTRVDVLAAAIRSGMRVGELIDLDLAYAPPYGQAKDAINLAGMVGENVLDGTLRLWDARELDAVRASSLILDVRTADEVATGMLPGALHIPHTELRGRLEEVRAAAAGRPVRVVCASGVRSAIAHRVLIQSGFDSASLSGGMLTLRATLGARADGVLADAAPVEGAQNKNKDKENEQR
ncbi:MAG: FAD-dependent oxidoreductase [Actinomyces sp.]|jgi:NADPH-dependent 2,4-dienoyl-CoA reductase/sulfur reductase-like enzyme/rhodanese-related sulfurtransferase|uniref:FAD-dependent oxidoreductase n=1 Tax=Schaalia naturae TaxID=635203 RepID=A0ABW2SKQ8_9ACTO|nr:FAD-dependent oxidoreductase [Actinomyces sp.]MCI1642228.1 FAD-dependent oxidoreductase [Actinomyces sp.]MCI1662587.1 FAD-dependent oxidoreductase [Actinomyces sp.]MCI1690964.1 FAD-dependent oxidoreductase [Actinomyces sp.]MCI1788307.1 FAD-dependent oxidoreductase [Actinomyces sp.]MCI1831233.1 FAD-dependent oxidoreductase [Actinomyces sp.]